MLYLLQLHHLDMNKKIITRLIFDNRDFNDLRPLQEAQRSQTKQQFFIVIDHHHGGTVNYTIQKQILGPKKH